MSRISRTTAAALLALAASATAASAAPVPRPHAPVVASRSAAPALDVTAPSPTSGARSAGDPYFPATGNGGYDATHYGLNLTYVPGAQVLAGATRMRATATQDLSDFSLDLQGFQVTDVTVDGATAAFTRENTKLIVTPASPLAEGQSFEVEVTYAGQPPVIVDPDNSIEGFIPTNDGAFVVGEPIGAQGWFPCNNHPSDKATYDIRMTVPPNLTVVSNGELAGVNALVGANTWHWKQNEPMATYLATATLGSFDFTTAPGPHGINQYLAVDKPLNLVQGATIGTRLGRIPEIIDFFEGLYGEYPFSAAGAIVDLAPEVGYALETQTKPNYPLAPSMTTIAHETSHQWFGDSVSLELWKDMWLNEGFATWSEWVFDERRNSGTSTAAEWTAGYNDPNADWSVPPAEPGGPENMFSEPVYHRGALTLEGLRQIVGEPTFLKILRDWYSENRDGNVNTADFIALAERDSGLELSAYFQQWLYEPTKPTITPSNFPG